jgi:hypothetical protein
VLVVAGVDALRSSGDSEISAPTASTPTTTTTASPTGSLPPCTQRDLRVSIEVREGIATVVARNTGAKECYRLLRGWHLTIEDRAGNPVEEWTNVRLLVDGLFPAGSERAFWLPQETVLCGSPGPYLARATVGPYSARLGNLSRSEVACGFRGGTQASRLRARYVARAHAICTAATATFGAAPALGADLEAEATWSKAAARASEEALASLRALRPPKADRARVNRIYALMERQTDLLRQLAAAASAGERARVNELGQERIRATHRKDELALGLALLWDAPPEALYGCPVSLPA